MTRFDDLNLDPKLVQAVHAMGFETPTPIQAEAIPVLLAGRDVVGGARTGSGKTAAFGLPLLHRVREGGAVRALVLAPTRELALQVEDAMSKFASALSIELVCVYGGAPYDPQLRALRRGATVVVGTPGRLIDHLERGSLDLSNVEMLVLDEADEMLRMGFLEDVEKLLKATPPTRQIALFSATMPKPIRRIADAYLKNPVQVQVEQEALSVDHIEQRWIGVPQRFKLDTLQRVLKVAPPGGALVFARTRAACAEVADALAKAGVGADALHGDLSQIARERVLNRLRSESLDVLVATDVAARGLDVDHLGLVVNLDLPESTEVYVHRIGRTGRAGRKGMAISFVTPRERRQILSMEHSLGVKIQQFEPPSDQAIHRAQRRRLSDQVGRALQALDADLVAWAAELAEEHEASPDQVAGACLALVAETRGWSMTTPSDDAPVAWTRSEPPAERPTKGPDRGSEGPPDHDSTNEVELYIPMGRRDGLRPNDIVGALANEAGISGRDIGRITLFGGNCFVGLPRHIADHILANHAEIEIRGHAVTLTPAHGSTDDRTRKPRRGETQPPAREFIPKKRPRFDKPKGLGDRRGKKTPRGRR
jgi:ATP-dependent RNA helicase DeaD